MVGYHQLCTLVEVSSISEVRKKAGRKGGKQKGRKEGRGADKTDLLLSSSLLSTLMTSRQFLLSQKP